MKSCIGWDIGGAHLKMVWLSPGNKIESAIQLPCPLWQGVSELKKALIKVIAGTGMEHINDTGHHAVTMTGEMADCFKNREDGVRHILDTVKTTLQGELFVYTFTRGFVSMEEALGHPASVAAANWHATASCIAGLEKTGVLVDTGTTTTDIIPFISGRVVTQGSSDSERLASSELVYSGIVRTPVMAITRNLSYQGRSMAVVAEMFATMADVYRITGDLPEQIDQYPGCDGAEKTPVASMQRLARMFGFDYDGDSNFWKAIATRLADEQVQIIASACHQIRTAAALTLNAPVIGAGAGRFLAKRIAAQERWPYKSFSQLFPPGLDVKTNTEVDDYASALAVAWLLCNRY